MSTDQRGARTGQEEAGSFRDRSGRIYYHGGEVFRGINEKVLGDWKALQATKFFSRAIEAGKIVRTTDADPGLSSALDPGRQWSAVLRHDTIPFISYPYEWSFGMLKDAASLHLELLSSALEERMILKDSSSFNIQWAGARPIFIDIPSFERLAPNTPWSAYLQFCRMFLYPLFLQAYKGVHFHAFLRGNIEGLEPEEMLRLMSLRDRFRPGVLTHVYLHAKMQSRYAAADRSVKRELSTSGFSTEMIKANVASLRKLVSGLEWKQSSSTWANYAQDNSYSEIDAKEKASFVRSVVQERRRRLVWDIGCNTGTFSRIASENSDYVVAMDYDHLAVERLYRELKREGSGTILPLVVNLANASPSHGWRGMERKGLTERSRPELVLSLALIHHMVIGANVPLAEFVAWLASLGSDLVIEFVTKEDPMVKILLRNREDQYDDYTIDNFRAVLSRHFTIRRELPIPSGTRFLFHAERHN